MREREGRERGNSNCRSGPQHIQTRDECACVISCVHSLICVGDRIRQWAFPAPTLILDFAHGEVGENQLLTLRARSLSKEKHFQLDTLPLLPALNCLRSRSPVHTMKNISLKETTTELVAIVLEALTQSRQCSVKQSVVKTN